MDTLVGRVAVVTGGASGIGFAMARRFAAEGMKVVIADIEQAALDRAHEELEADGAEVGSVRTDVSKREHVERLAATTMERFGAVHVLCNNAGVEMGAPFSDISEATWRWVMGVNFWGVLHGCQVFLPLLREQREGHIVNTASTAAFATGLPTFTPYSVSKFAVHSLSENLEIELRTGGEPIGVSLLVPGMTKSNMPLAERNRPADVEIDQSPQRAAVLDMIARAMAEKGLDPAVTAGMVVDAIRAKQFFILTHKEQTLDAVRTRLEWMETGKAASTRKPSSAG